MKTLKFIEINLMPLRLRKLEVKMLHGLSSLRNQTAFGTALKAEKLREHMWDGVHLVFA